MIFVMDAGLSGRDEKLNALVRDLPDPEGARLFLGRISAEHPRAVKIFERDAGLLHDALALAAWSPLLGTTITQHPDYLAWLARERGNARTKTAEELGESLARFGSLHSQTDAHILLARFRRRELLRIYLRDIRRTSTLVETTEELSNLADAVLSYALNLAAQELDNRYGAPLFTDERGRARRAEFCIVALGKLGSRELNYASDIDLLFLYSDDGTSGGGERGSTTNREYFNKLASRIAHIVGEQSGEGAAYRVDLRLRPYGRDGALCCSLAEAVRYYREAAQRWELQTLIRAHAAAGSLPLYTRFADGVRDSVYRADETRASALEHIRLAKQKIDREHGGRGHGFNVKLGRGGVREIEFIAQALQLAYGGRDRWLQRAPHTLVSLGRLTDRGFIAESERTKLSDAYAFLRALEHRVQMEHGLQTHTVPEDTARRLLVARRMNFTGHNALESFDETLNAHTENVRRIFESVFNPSEQKAEKQDQTAKRARVEEDVSPEVIAVKEPGRTISNRDYENSNQSIGHEKLTLSRAASVFSAHITRRNGERDREVAERTMRCLESALAREGMTARRAVSMLTRIAASLDKLSVPVELSEETLRALVRLCGTSQFFGEIIAANPTLIAALPVPGTPHAEPDYRELLIKAVESEASFGTELAVLRSTWTKLWVEIGARDVAGEITLRESNWRQTALAAASIDAALVIATRELARRHNGRLQTQPRLAVLGLGRLGGGGMDYGSDLDVVLVYDEYALSPVAELTSAHAYAQFAELFVATLSSLTRDGYLYRVDLRLRPDGRNGAIASGARAFVNYLRERAAVWEWLAYMRIHAVGGDLQLGMVAANEARRTIHEAARRVDAETLRAETRRVRERLHRERGAKSSIDIKFGAGGMLDVYFASRYLQLRDDVFEGNAEDRSTLATLDCLRAAGSLNEEDHNALHTGYALLRRVDHYMRLTAERSPRVPPADHPVLQQIARSMNYASPSALIDDLAAYMQSVRTAYDRIMETKHEG